MSIISSTSDYSLLLAKAIGLDTRNLRSFKLIVEPNDLITVEAVYFVTQSGMTQLTEEVKKFTLKPKEE